jgi:signal transduction histidine kinase
MPIRVLYYDQEDSGTLPWLSPRDGSTETVATVTCVSTEADLRTEIEKGNVGLIILGHLTEWPWLDILVYLNLELPKVPRLLLLEENDPAVQRQALLAGVRQTLARNEPDVAEIVIRQYVQEALSADESARMKEALAAAEWVLQKNQKSIALGVLLGSIAHEINNPLEGIGNLLYLAKRAKVSEDDVLACLDLAEEELSRVSQITKQMLSFHRDAKRPEDFCVTDVLDGILVLFSAKLRERRIRVVRQFYCPGWMVAYPGELRQAFVNLISNAVDAMPQGGCLTLKVRERPGRVAHLCVSIADTGQGMSRERIKSFGELFATTKGESGTGLGGWVTRKLLSKYGGALKIYSSQQEGRSGTVMKICVPHPFARITGNTRPGKAATHKESSPIEQNGDDSDLRCAS